MLEPIIPAVLEAQDKAGDATQNAIRQNGRRVVENLRDFTDPVLGEPQRDGRLKVVGAIYALGSGRVLFFDTP